MHVVGFATPKTPLMHILGQSQNIAFGQARRAKNAGFQGDLVTDVLLQLIGRGLCGHNWGTLTLTLSLKKGEGTALRLLSPLAGERIKVRGQPVK
jgi:hypothetical protein